MPSIPKTPAPVAIRTTPAYPVPGRAFRVTAVDAGTATGTHVRIWCTHAPPGTKLRQQLDESRSGKVIFHDLIRLDSEASPSSFDLTLEKGGGYALQIDEIQVGTGFTGGYEDDPRGAPSETIKSSRFSTLYVATPLTIQLGSGQDVATLKLYVHNETVVQTEFAVHGETTPRVELPGNATSKARMAAEGSAFRALVGVLPGQTAEALVGDVGASLDDLIGKVNGHLDGGGRHLADDADNVIANTFLGATTPTARAASLSELRRLLARHLRNDNGSGTGSAGYHTGADWQNLPIESATPADALTDGISHADVWRAYEAHRLSSVHAKTDKTNVASSLPTLLEVHRLFLATLAAASPDAPITTPAGAALLISQLGFKDA